MTYEVAHSDKGKASQVYRINLLNEWKEREPDKVLLVHQVKEEDGKFDSNLQQLLQPKTPPLEHLPSRHQQKLQMLFREIPGLFRDGPGRTTLIQHTICLLKADTPPIRQRPYHIPQWLVGPLKDEVQKMLDLGVIEPSVRKWSSPMVMVPKKDGSQRPCVDFRKINAASCFDVYPMPRIDDLVTWLGLPST